MKINRVSYFIREHKWSVGYGDELGKRPYGYPLGDSCLSFQPYPLLKVLYYIQYNLPQPKEYAIILP